MHPLGVRGVLGLQKMSVRVYVGGRANYLGKVLGFRQILKNQVLDPKGGTMEFMSCFIPIISYMYFINMMPNCNSSTVCSLSSSLPLSSVPLCCSLPAPLKGLWSWQCCPVPWELFTFLSSSRPSHLSYVEGCASLFNVSYPTIPNTSPKYLDTTVFHCLKTPEHEIPFYLKQDQCLHCCK